MVVLPLARPGGKRCGKRFAFQVEAAANALHLDEAGDREAAIQSARDIAALISDIKSEERLWPGGIAARTLRRGGQPEESLQLLQTLQPTSIRDQLRVQHERGHALLATGRIRHAAMAAEAVLELAESAGVDARIAALGFRVEVAPSGALGPRAAPPTPRTSSGGVTPRSWGAETMTAMYDVLLSVDQPGIGANSVRFRDLPANGDSSCPTWEIRGPGLISYRFRVSLRAGRGGRVRVEVPWAVVLLRAGRPPLPEAERHP